VLGLAAAAAPVAGSRSTANLKELEAETASALSAEKQALSALGSDPIRVRIELEKSLSELRSVKAGAAAAGGGAAVSPLGQAISGDMFALDHLNEPAERGAVRSKLNIAIARKEAAEQVFGNIGKAPAPVGPPAQSMPIDAAKGITAEFEQAYFATFYSVDQTNTNLYPATIDWKLTPPSDDPACRGFLPVAGRSPIRKTQKRALNSERAGLYQTLNGHPPNAAVGELLDSVAVWWHADVSEHGLCNHAGNAYQPTQYGHGGLVSVTVENRYWTCTASFKGTLTGGAGVPVDAPEPGGGYPNGWRGPATCTAR
jgi:hypothetical protein